MIDAIKRENWDEAIAQMWDSDMGREPRFIARLRRTEKLLRDEKVIEYGTN
jgi:hypothetical protein